MTGIIKKILADGTSEIDIEHVILLWSYIDSIILNDNIYNLSWKGVHIKISEATAKILISRLQLQPEHDRRLIITIWYQL